MLFNEYDASIKTHIQEGISLGPDPYHTCAINTESGGWGKKKERVWHIK